MKTGTLRSGVRLAAFLLIVVLCVFALVGCGLSVETDETEPETTETPAVTTAPTPTEPAVGEGVTPVRTVDGASIVLNPTGLSFTALADKDYIDALISAYGEENVRIGVMVVPTDSISGGSFDPAAENVVKVNADSFALTGEGYRADCGFAVTEEANYTVSYTAVAYVEVLGTVLRCADYSSAAKGTLATAAKMAMLALSDERSSVYKYEIKIGNTTKYSPYTQRQYDLLAQIRLSIAFTVMSYNIEVYATGLTGGGWEGRNPAKALATVVEQSPDIVGFQEVNSQWNDMLDNLAQNNGYTRLKGTGTDDAFERNEIFFKTDKFTKIAEGTKTFKKAGAELNIPNSENADQSLDKHGRIFHYVVLEQITTGKKILVVNTHLHYGGTGEGHEEDDKVRRYEIRTLLAWLATQEAEYPNRIVMGDMNSHYKGTGQGSVNMALFTDAGYLRTSDTAEVTDDVGGTLATGSDRATRPQYIFDYILTKGNHLKTAYYTVVNNKIDNNNTSYPSDHIPILAQLYIQ
ncbi:MAG: endonuclease/exonuclease/phosphatase family protein [Clostridia bacterium]|nr:endonuclease/exonuclease/phosphatase family protein [Methanomicrobium sp.]MBR5044381.1 endonuclease/exonuclease/phosphatase family protein [Clostridia bacterium]